MGNRKIWKFTTRYIKRIKFMDLLSMWSPFRYRQPQILFLVSKHWSTHTTIFSLDQCPGYRFRSSFSLIDVSVPNIFLFRLTVSLGQSGHASFTSYTRLFARFTQKFAFSSIKSGQFHRIYRIVVCFGRCRVNSG